MDAPAADVAIVTGAASGIGAALASLLADRGQRLVLVDRDGPTLEACAAALGASRPVVPVVADVTASEPLAAAVEHARALGTLRTVCLNAGVTTTGPTIWETSDERLDLMLDVNVRGLVRCLRDVVPAVIEHGGSSQIMITASMAGLVASPGSAVYAASKAGAVAIARALRAELAAAAPKVRVTVLNPGMVRTNLLRTSAASHGGDAMPTELVSGAHDALNTYGIAPAEAARIALDAADAGRFWALPPAGDGFLEQLRAELDELRTSF